MLIPYSLKYWRKEYLAVCRILGYWWVFFGGWRAQVIIIFIATVSVLPNIKILTLEMNFENGVSDQPLYSVPFSLLP